MPPDTRLVIIPSSALTGAEAVNTAAVLGLAATAYTSDLDAKAVDRDGALTETARRSRDYDDYPTRLAGARSAEVQYTGLAVYGLRSRVTAATKRLALYGAS